ncbi:DUF4198 domain-containing protein [candidate division WOR-3 bacterium]|nr:DUF4198 domain-containing protein [candidate division WOR-3 bacterium]
MNSLVIKSALPFMFIVVIFAILMILPCSIYGHTMWLNITDFSPKMYPKYGATTKIYFGWGHNYQVDDFLNQELLKEFYFICPRCGEHHTLVPNPGGFLATKVNFEKPGAYIVAAVLKPGFYTMFIEKGEMCHKMGAKTDVKGKIIMSLYYEQYAKALIMVGIEDTATYKNPIGHKIEIVPLKNPSILREGNFLPIQVLFDGRPAKYYEVFATYSGFSTGEDFAYATSTDSEGKARIRLIHYGPWLVKTATKVPATDDLKDKCDELHYTATLTFEVR